MPKPTIGVSILTNGARRHWLERCVSSFLENCYYRPLVISIYNNGSTDDTEEWISNLPKQYGIQYRAVHSDIDMGCAHGTNESIQLVDDCEFQIHLESDFIHMPESETGVDKLWLHRAVEWMQNGDCDYIYLRRMENETDMLMHWWSQWMPKMQDTNHEFMSCPGFWWSNNPTLFRTRALFDAGTLPLKVEIDGQKGSAGWSQPELQAARPPNPCIHQWGMFAHERKEPHTAKMGCGKFPEIGASSCKYGFYKNGKELFCRLCDLKKGIEDMPAHDQRLRQVLHERNSRASLVTVVVNRKTFENYLRPSIDGNNILGEHIIREAEEGRSLASVYNQMIDEAHHRYLIFSHPDVTFSSEFLEHVRQQLSMDHVGVVGGVGVDDCGRQIWAGSLIRPEKLSSLDGCFFAIDRKKGLRFDEETFDGLHLYAEDLCFQARGKGLKVYVVPANEFTHHSETFGKMGACWGDYTKYKQRLIEKWSGKMKVVTT